MQKLDTTAEQGRYFAQQALIRTDVFTTVQIGLAAYEFIKKHGPTAWTQLCAQISLEIRERQAQQVEGVTDDKN